MADLLFEAGMEEIPARMIAPAEAELTERIVELLRRERLLAEGHEVHSYSTPRRVAVQVNGVLARQPDATREMTGPAWSVAFKDGQATAAGQAFARKAGVGVAALEKISTPKGEYVAAKALQKGRGATDVLSDLLAAELAALYWPKNMNWRPLKPERFVRPVRWMVALLDHAVLPVEFGGVQASNQTFGHRILHGNAPLSVDHPDDYLGVLESASVTADVHLRRHRIRKALDLETRSVPGARWREDAALVETVTHLTEWPSVVLGGFDREYLELPEEVLVTVMRDHQKYFAVENTQGKLEPYFLAVLNTRPEEKGIDVIRHGNERVLRARFNDARFFWRVDQKIPLEDRVEMLKSVTFHKELGSYWDKTQANLAIAERLAALLTARGVAVDVAALRQAVLLAKTDLTTELVKEFTELQGIVGGLYARAQGLGETVAQAVYWQYSPAAIEDPIPPTVEGQLLGIADRIQTIVAMFGIGLEPTGSKDPFALRRAANAIVKILAESDVRLNISDILKRTDEGIAEILSDRESGTGEKIRAFFRERVEFWLREVRGFAYDVVNAIMALGGWSDIPDAIARAEALSVMRNSEDFRAVCVAFKRTRNIIEQANAKGLWREGFPDKRVESRLLVERAEQQLSDQTEKIAPLVEELRANRKYQEALELIAKLRPDIDRFFESVMVMVDDSSLRNNRLALLARIYFQFSSIAVFSELVSA
ncbi:MAG TPA: glycine--tRNA ligase subunit beta [Acidobacteriaceae bacterium]|jgi:glycyl-tRNA synthetase beta chain|nr:glycine--tRNA ligase subunit beta [Acidobacteriaceae bacterium]